MQKDTGHMAQLQVCETPVRDSELTACGRPQRNVVTRERWPRFEKSPGTPQQQAEGERWMKWTRYNSSVPP